MRLILQLGYACTFLDTLENNRSLLFVKNKFQPSEFKCTCLAGCPISTDITITALSVCVMEQKCNSHVVEHSALILFSKAYDFQKVQDTRGQSLSVCLCVCLCLCVSLASDSSETIEVIITKLSMVTASDMVMHHVLIILTLTFIQGRTDLNHENNKCPVISESVQAIPITFAVNIVQLKV